MWRSTFNALWLLLLLAPAAPAHSPAHGSPGSLVSVEVLVEGRRVPLYPAPDGSDRWYLEAREGARYSLRLQNRTPRRLAVSLGVDGLDAISGVRSAPHRPGSDPGRMYVLEPWDATEISGWRSSLRDVQRFVFVDERVSYAARTGQANARMGWIELAVYRERYPRWPRALGEPAGERPDWTGDRAQESAKSPAAPPALGSARRSHPGTGWGPRAHEPVQLVAFDPEPHPAERVTLRYEYREALAALGIVPGRHAPDRLREREAGEYGFARPPLW